LAEKRVIYDSCYNARMEQDPTMMQELYKAVINAFTVSFFYGVSQSDLLCG